MNNELLNQVYQLGFVRCSEWAQRDDLPHDIESPAYRKDRTHDLSTISQTEHLAPCKSRTTNELKTYVVKRSPNKTQRISSRLKSVMVFVSAKTKKEAISTAMQHEDFGFGEEKSENGTRLVLDYSKPTAMVVAPGNPFFI